jgi:hypothetical protein
MFKTITQDSEKCLQPDKIKIPLKPHQLSIINEMSLLENSSIKTTKHNINSKIGILADNVGSGKTLSTLGVIAHKSLLSRVEKMPESFDNMVSIQFNNSSTLDINTNIIVVPHTILSQWETTLKQQTTLKYIVLAKTKQLQKFISNINNIKNEELNITEPENPELYGVASNYRIQCRNMKISKIMSQYDVILMSASCYNNLCDDIFNTLSDIMVSRVIFDEADTIKIPACRTPNTKFTWMITSTYNNIIYPSGKTYWINNITNEIRNNVYFDERATHTRARYYGINHNGFIKDSGKVIEQIRDKFPSLIKHLILRNDDAYIKSSFMLQEPSDNYIICQYPANMNIIKDVIGGEVLRMLNAGNVSGAIEKLSCSKVNNENNLVKLVTEDLERELHNTRIELEMKRQLHYQNEETKKQAINKLVEKEAIITTKITHIKAKLIEKANCPICYDTIENKTLIKCCNTSYCLECITIWLSMNSHHGCPFCRSKVTMQDVVIINTNCKESASKKEEIRDKIYHLKNYLKEATKNPNFKLLIFADYYESFGAISNVLNELKLSSSMIKGSASSVNKTIERYKSTEPGSLDVLMLNSEYCGSGINLENTTDVVIFHYMNEQKDRQIIGRAQRPGRTSKLNIMRLCYENEEQYIRNISSRIDEN